MCRTIRTLKFPGQMTKRGFSLYVWKIEHPKKGELLYVGRTGDTSSPNASSPIRRMGQHFHPVNKGNSLYRWLKKYHVDPEFCTSFNLFSYGPIFKEVVPDGTEPKDSAERRRALMGRYRGPRDVIAGLEKALADTLCEVGYEVMNPVHGRRDTQSHHWHQVLEAFRHYFPKMNRVLHQYPCGPQCSLQGENPA